MIIKILLVCSIIVNMGLALQVTCLDIVVKALVKILQDCKNHPITRDEIIEHLPETIKKYIK